MGLDFIFIIAILIMSVVLHELAHGYSALMLGDPTAKYANRLTLNPLKHLDLVGSIIVPLFLFILQSGIIFGWAKPVPYNPYNLKNPKWGEAIVAGAGPLTNIFIALVFGLLIRFSIMFGMAETSAFVSLAGIVVVMNIVLAIFNLVPVPPLDGSKILFSVLPYKYNQIRVFLERFGLIILLFFILFLWKFLSPLVIALFRLFTGIGLNFF